MGVSPLKARRGMNFDKPVTLGMSKCEKRGVQQHRFPFRARAIEPITNQGRPEAEPMGTVYPELVGPAGAGAGLHQGNLARSGQSAYPGDRSRSPAAVSGAS